jgi:hypothetical protein
MAYETDRLVRNRFDSTTRATDTENRGLGRGTEARADPAPTESTTEQAVVFPFHDIISFRVRQVDQVRLTFR